MLIIFADAVRGSQAICLNGFSRKIQFLRSANTRANLIPETGIIKQHTHTLPKVLVRPSGGCYRCPLHVGGHQRSRQSTAILSGAVAPRGTATTSTGSAIGGGHFRFHAPCYVRTGMLAKVIFTVESFSTLATYVLLFARMNYNVERKLFFSFEGFETNTTYMRSIGNVR